MAAKNAKKSWPRCVLFSTYFLEIPHTNSTLQIYTSKTERKRSMKNLLVCKENMLLFRTLWQIRIYVNSSTRFSTFDVFENFSTNCLELALWEHCISAPTPQQIDCITCGHCVRRLRSHWISVVLCCHSSLQ